jgi:hypothetical protein
LKEAAQFMSSDCKGEALDSAKTRNPKFKIRYKWQGLKNQMKDAPRFYTRFEHWRFALASLLVIRGSDFRKGGARDSGQHIRCAMYVDAHRQARSGMFNRCQLPARGNRNREARGMHALILNRQKVLDRRQQLRKMADDLNGKLLRTTLLRRFL